jgi:small neutral amino acid transporter SnatA (MarC family)
MPSFGTIAIVLFFTLNSLGNLPIFIALLSKYSPRAQFFIILREMIIALVLILLFAFAGQDLLSLLGLSPQAVSVGGGIILLLISIRLVFPHHHFGTIKQEQGDVRPLIVPLATPIMAGGGTLATVMMFGLQSTSDWTLFFGILGAWVPSTIIVLLGPVIARYAKGEVLVAIERLSGLILILIAAEMLMSGMTEFIGGRIENRLQNQDLLTNAEAGENRPQYLFSYIRS